MAGFGSTPSRPMPRPAPPQQQRNTLGTWNTQPTNQGRSWTYRPPAPMGANGYTAQQGQYLSGGMPPPSQSGAFVNTPNAQFAWNGMGYGMGIMGGGGSNPSIQQLGQSYNPYAGMNFGGSNPLRGAAGSYRRGGGSTRALVGHSQLGPSSSHSMPMPPMPNMGWMGGQPGWNQPPAPPPPPLPPINNTAETPANLQQLEREYWNRLSSDQTKRATDQATSNIRDAAAGQAREITQGAARRGAMGTGAESNLQRSNDRLAQRNIAGAAAQIQMNEQQRKDNLVMGGTNLLMAPHQLAQGDKALALQQWLGAAGVQNNQFGNQLAYYQAMQNAQNQAFQRQMQYMGMWNNLWT